MSFDPLAVPYPGVFPRQDLVDVCQSEIPKLEKENIGMLETLDILERQRGEHIHAIHAIYEGLQHNYGYQKALRMVCEWAKDHVVESDPIPDAEDEIGPLVNGLREKYNA